MFKIRVRWRTALALCLWALSVSWIPSSAVAGSECGSGAPVVTQRAPWGGKSSPREGAAQVVVRMMVTAGEMRAGEPVNGLDAGRRRSLRQQVAGDPQIDDAPIGLRKAVGDPPALHTTTVEGAGLRGRDVCNGSPVAGRGGNRGVGRRQRPQWRGGSGRLQQGVGLWRQARTGVQQSDPGSMAARSAPIYTHGYGITMNPVNGFTPEGLPTLILSYMPVQGTVRGLSVTRPEIYFGEMTNTDVYVKTRQKEFNYPQGASNSLTSYEGNGGIVLGGFLRRIVIALDRDDLAKLPFSDDVNKDSRLLMRRNLRDRVSALAPFLTFEPDPYIVLGDDGRLSWIMDAFTLSDSFPYSTHYQLDNNSINYMRNSVKVVIDAYDGTTTFYVFDTEDPIIAAYRRIFPSLFKDASLMPPGLRKHVRYPELLLKLQAEVYGLYHMTDPEAFYNREDLWTVATEVGMGEGGQQTTQAMQPNFVLMKLPEETGEEFVEILPFTPANRNNLIGWIAGRSDGAQYGTSVVYNFPKTKLVDGPLQIEARIDQNAQLSGQLTLWNHQGSHVRRGALLVIPIGRALLYAEPIYLQAERSPMPELRLVVLALQDRLAYGPTFESALASLFGGAVSSLTAPSTSAAAVPAEPARGATAADLNALIAEAARDLADYQRLTAEGKLGEAGQKLEELKRVLDKLNTRPK